MYIISQGIKVEDLINTKDSILLDKFNNLDDGILIDVRMTQDNILILCKEALIYKKYFINKTNYNLLKKINLTKIHRLYLPTLIEVLHNYPKEVLVIRLHHNYDQNDILIKKLTEVLANVHNIKIIIIVDNDYLYDYLKSNTDYEIYLSNSSNLSFNNDDYLIIDN